MSFKVSCAYCSEPYTNTDFIYSTTCGHVYHFACMQQWKSRSTSCPECRSYNPGSHKIYLNFEANDDEDDKIQHLTGSVASLKTLNDELKDKLKLAEWEFLQLQEQYTEKENQIKDFKMISEKRKAELQNGHAAIEDLHEQLKDAISKSLNLWQESTSHSKTITKVQMPDLASRTTHPGANKPNEYNMQAQARAPLCTNDGQSNIPKDAEINQANINYKECWASGSSNACDNKKSTDGMPEKKDDGTFSKVHQLFAKAKELKNYGFRVVYVKRGKVYAKFSKHDRPILIQSFEQVDEMIEQQYDDGEGAYYTNGWE